MPRFTLRQLFWWTFLAALVAFVIGLVAWSLQFIVIIQSINPKP